MTFGVVTIIGGTLLYRATHKPIPAKVLAEARSLSVDPTQLADLDQLDDKLFAKTPLSDEEWARYKACATGSNLIFKHKVARHLCATMGSTREQEARSLVNTLIADPDPQTRACALISLRKFGDPQWREVARRFLSDSSSAPREMGAAMLRQDGQRQ
jgi:hypothetical protein